jgi:DNA-binding transcriptional ArsR family regulator
MTTAKATNTVVDASAEDVDFATAIGNPWRFRILYAVSTKPMSPSQFVSEVGGEISNISRHFRRLEGWGYLEVAEKKTGGSRRGGVEHIYRGTQRAHLDTPTSQGLSLALRQGISNTILNSLFQRVEAAVDADALDADIERHLSWMALNLDKQAFRELGERLDEVLAWLPELESEAAVRLRHSGEEGIAATAALLSFRTPAVRGPEASSPVDGRGARGGGSEA